MRAYSWLERVTITAGFGLAQCLVLAWVFVATGAAATTPTVHPARSGAIRTLITPATLSTRQHSVPPLIVHEHRDTLCCALRTKSLDDDDAIQDDAPPIGLVASSGRLPALQPLGTLSVRHVIARGYHGPNRRSPRGPPAAS